MLAIGDINNSSDDRDKERVVLANTAITSRDNNDNNSDVDALVEGGEFYAEMDRLIASFVQLEKEHQISKKQLISRISSCLVSYQITDVKGNSPWYNKLFLLYAKYELGTGCSFKIPYNIEKYKSDYGFEMQIESATTELNPYIKLKFAKPGK